MIKYGWWFSLDVVVTDDEGEKVRFISVLNIRYLVVVEWDTTWRWGCIEVFIERVGERRESAVNIL